MKPTRRDVLSSLTAMAVLPACGSRKSTGGADTRDTGDTGDTGGTVESAPERADEPPPWNAPGTEDATAFAWGVQLGDPTPTTVRVGLWTTETAVAMTLMRAQDTDWIEVETRADLSPEDGRLQLDLDSLSPDTAYSVVFATPDLDRRTRVARFRTALDEDGWRILTVGVTSCLGSEGRPWPNMSHLAEEDVDVFVLLGDGVYAYGADSEDDFLAYWSTSLSAAGLQDVCAHSAVVATWDDHEVENNFEGQNVAPELLAAALGAFRSALPQTIGPGGTGVWRKLSWGTVMDLFVLDCRGERDGVQYISTEQMDWLKQGLSESTARFKLIANSVPITDYTAMMLNALADDRWQGYPEQREEILGHIEDTDIEGVLWLTGDFHMGTISRVGATGEIGEGQWEVMAGAAGSIQNPLADIYDNPEQFPIMFSAWNSVRLRLDPGRGEVRVTYIGDDGSVLAEKTLQI